MEYVARYRFFGCGRRRRERLRHYGHHHAPFLLLHPRSDTHKPRERQHISFLVKVTVDARACVCEASVLFMRHGVGVVQLPVVLRRRLRAFVLDLYPQLFSQRW